MAARKINMDPNNIDPNYRYKFEKLIVKNEGKNTGKQTLMMNIYNIASDIIGVEMDENNKSKKYLREIIDKTAKHMTQFMSKKLGGQCQYKKERRITIISGRHEINILQNYLFEYVDKYSKCPCCGNEELTPAVINPVICKSCGQYQDDDKSKKKRKNKNLKKKPKKKTKKKRKQTDENKENDDDDDDDDDNDGDDDEKQKIARDPIYALKHFVNENENISTNDIMEKIRILSLAHKLNRKQQIRMAIYSLLRYNEDNYKLFIESIKKHSSIFETFTLLNNDTKIFFAYIEEIIMHKSGGDNLLNHSYAIFNCLYDEDIFGEDEIIEWYQNINYNKFAIIDGNESKLIRNKTQTFVKWLEETQDDESDNDESDNND